MKIIECCPFFKENLIAGIHINESAKWVDEIHITECNMTHQYTKKDYFFEFSNLPKVHYHQLNAEKIFLKSRKRIPYIQLFNRPEAPNWHSRIFKNTSWYNDGVQRKKTVPEFEDDDILVLSDIDEIIDSRFAKNIIDEVKKRGIITVKLYYSLFYFNLFCKNWGGPPDYSYRVFIVTGKVFREQWKSDYDTLRKAGERSQLTESVYCLPEISGFHHSWLGDEKFISEKLAAYSHVDQIKFNDLDHIKDSLRRGVSIFPGQELEIDNCIALLDYVEENKDQYKSLFI